MAVQGVVVGRLKRRLIVRRPILSIWSSSVFVRVQDSQLFVKLGMILVSKSTRMTFVSIPRMTSDEAVVFICLTIFCILFSFISRFILFW